ncbi:MAG TPA: sugar ABC transporter permease [Thermomicrobiales bacterium]|nr:sugar ABC transporter permease [Thermomicrobiales bacterium]
MATPAATRRIDRRRPGERARTAYLYLLPAFAIYALFVLLPVVQTVRYSFYDWDGFSTPTWSGFANYAALVDDKLFRMAIGHNLVLIVFFTIFPIAIALVLTSLLTRRDIKGMNLFRAGLFVPQVMSMVVVGVVWRWIYNPVSGPLNQTLRAVGLDHLAVPWLGEPATALPAVGAVGTWVSFGFALVLFIAGVQRIDEDLYDAAKLDGANGVQQFFAITLPALRNEVTVVLVTLLITALRTFDLIFVTTRGGPANRTQVVALLLYKNAFTINRAGYAAAIAVILTLVILLVSYVVITLRMRSAEA